MLLNNKLRSTLLLCLILVSSCSSDLILKNRVLIEQGKQAEAIRNLTNSQVKEDESMNEEFHYTLAKAYFSNKDYLNAQKSIRTALILNAFESRYYLLSGKIFFHLKQYFKATNTFSKAIEFDANLLEAYYFQASAFQLSGKKGFPLHILKKALALDPLYFDAIILKYNIEFQNILTVQALEKLSDEFETALLISPEDAEGNLLMASLDWELGRSLKALKRLESWNKNNPKNLKISIKLAELYYALGNSIAAKKLIDPTSSFKEKLLWIKLSIDQGALLESQKEIDQSIKNHPSNAELYYLQALIAYRQRNLFYAETSLNQSISLDPEYFPSRELKAKILLENQDLEGALIEIESALLLKPIDQNLFFKKLEVLLEIGRWKEVLSYKKEELTKLNPQKALKIQGILYLKQKSLLKAIEVLEQAAKIQFDTEIENQLALAELQAGRINTAKNRLNKVLQLFPKDMETSLNLAHLAFIEKKWKEAIQISEPFLQDTKSKGRFHLIQAESFVQQNKLALAIQVLRLAHQSWNTNMEIANQYTFYLGLAKKYKEAIIILKEFIERDHPYQNMLSMRLVYYQQRLNLNWKQTLFQVKQKAEL